MKTADWAQQQVIAPVLVGVGVGLICICLQRISKRLK